MSDSPDEGHILLHEIEDDQLTMIVRQLYDTTLAPRFQVLITQGFVERFVNAVIDAKCKNAKKITNSSRDFPYSTKLLLLHELGLISDEMFQTLNGLRKHRNDAAHDPFYSLSDTIVHKGQPAGRLHEYCIQVICDFFNEHRGILGPLFAPKTLAKGGGVVVFPRNYRVHPGNRSTSG